MIKKLIIILFTALSLFAQQETGNKQENQNVELPEFVITGVERVNLPTVAKPKAELVPTLSESFFRPEYSTEELPVAELSNPIKREMKLFDNYSDLSSNLLLGVGLHTLPMGEFYYGKSFDHALLSGKIWGVREFPDDKFASRNNSGIKLNSSFLVSNNSSFMPGTKFYLNGLYNRETYKFFASDDPELNRDLHHGDFSFGLENVLNDYVKFGIGVSDKIIYLKDTDLNENVFGASGFFETYYKDFTINARVNYLNQMNKVDEFDGSRGYVDGSAVVGIQTSRLLKLKAGFNFATSEGSKLFLPYGFMAFRFSKFLSAFAEYNPGAKLITVYDLISTNRYYEGSPYNIMQMNEGGITFAVKYEYFTYFEINGGVKHDSYKNFTYFTDIDDNGFFETAATRARNSEVFLNLLFHLGPYGSFYSGAAFREFEDRDGNDIPYYSPFNANLRYSYNFPFGLGISPSLDFYSEKHTNIENTNKIPEYVDLSLNLEYELFKNFNIFSTFSNILGYKNHEWLGSNMEPYKGKPFDVVLGINYSW